MYTDHVHSILAKTIDADLPRFGVRTSSYLHKYTKATCIRTTPDDVHVFRLIHTPRQTVYASRAHIYQDGFKVFIPTTDKYAIFVDHCGMTQSIAFIMCVSEEQAHQYANTLRHPLYHFINNICRWGNFNNIRILQRFPLFVGEHNNIYAHFGITATEIAFIEKNI